MYLKSYYENICNRNSCTIWKKNSDWDDQVIVTGGNTSPANVNVYNYGYGFDKELATLKTGRWSHGCGQYINKDGQTVNGNFKILYLKYLKYLNRI